MGAAARTGGKAAREELCRLLAAAYLRLLRSRAPNSREVAQIGPSDSSEMTGYVSLRE